jgi:ribonuclease Z
MSFAVTILGSSSAVPTSKRFPTAQVLNVHERFFLIDCGEGTQIQLKRFGISSIRINHIFISHLHGDHVFGLFGLLSSYNLLARKADLHIFAHRDLEPTLDHFRKFFGQDLSYQIIFHPFTVVKKLEIYSDKHLTVEIIPLRHSVPVAGFIFRERQKKLNIRKESILQYNLGIRDIKEIKDGNDYVMESGEVISNQMLTLPPFRPRSYAFCTDTSYFKKIAGYLNNIDLLYFESTFSGKDKKLAGQTGHSTTIQAATVAKDANVGKLLIGHFSTRYKNVAVLEKEARTVFGNTTAVEDGEKYVVAETRVESPA